MAWALSPLRSWLVWGRGEGRMLLLAPPNPVHQKPRPPHPTTCGGVWAGWGRGLQVGELGCPARFCPSLLGPDSWLWKGCLCPSAVPLCLLGSHPPHPWGLLEARVWQSAFHPDHPLPSRCQLCVIHSSVGHQIRLLLPPPPPSCRWPLPSVVCSL